MRDVLPLLLAALQRDEPVALATVVRTWRSAPSPAGTAMIVTAAGEAVGSVSGGCVEGALYELCLDVLRTGEPVRRVFGVSDDDAFAVGLTCGGSLDVFVERVEPAAGAVLAPLASDLATGTPVAVAAVVAGPTGDAGLLGRRLLVRTGDAGDGSDGSGEREDPRWLGWLGGLGGLGGRIVADSVAMLESGTTGVLDYELDGDGIAVEPGARLEVLVTSFVPPPRLLVFGAADHAAALCRAGRLLGSRVTVVDARAVFATAARFPDADEVVVDWPHRWLASAQVDARDAVCVLTHDPKFDVPALVAAVRTPAGYVGAMGSRATHADRVARLREAGLTDAEIARIRSPIGLDIGARSPEETAVSIVAEIVRDRRGGSGASLSATDGPIHPEPGA